jgi:hypothetical protein
MTGLRSQIAGLRASFWVPATCDLLSPYCIDRGEELSVLPSEARVLLDVRPADDSIPI